MEAKIAMPEVLPSGSSRMLGTVTVVLTLVILFPDLEAPAQFGVLMLSAAASLTDEPETGAYLEISMDFQ